MKRPAGSTSRRRRIIRSRENLYRVKLDGSGLERLTTGPGDHRVILSPKANLFVDYVSSHQAPPTARLIRTDGKPVRTLDTNPVHALEEYDLGKLELVQIKTPDGFVLEGSILKPPDFDPARRYPVWFTTYGGPHAPVIHDRWLGGRLRDRGLANLGFLVFHVDPRSASGKGACSTWTAYRQLGVQELADIETAIRWLTSTYPCVDAVAHRHERAQLRRLHDGLRPDAQQTLRRRRRRRTGHGLAQLRCHLYRTLHEHAAGEPRRLRAHLRRQSGVETARAITAHPRHHGRQRPCAKLAAIRPRARSAPTRISS